MARVDSLQNYRWLVIVMSALIVLFSGGMIVVANGQVPPPEHGWITVTVDHEYLPINGSNTTITAIAYYKDGTPEPSGRLFFDNSGTNLGNLSGGTYTCFDGGELCWWVKYFNETIPVTMTLTTGSITGVEEVRVWFPGQEGNPNLDKTVNVTFTAEDTAPPQMTSLSATPSSILGDTGRPRATGTNRSQLTVTVTDEAGVEDVTIDLSAIGGSAAQPLQLISGTATNGVWSVTTGASTGINATHALPVTATDLYGKSNNAVSINLEVLRRGDVVRDNVVDMKDAVYIGRFTVGLDPEASNPPSVFLADVVGNAGDPAGDGKVDMKDALYIARWATGLEPAAP